MDFTYHAIGVLRTPFPKAEGAPIQPAGALGVAGTLELLPEYAAGLADIEGFSHLIVLYHLHKVEKVSLTVTPFLDSTARGLFATRAPCRPNPVGLSVVRLVRAQGNVLYLENVDMVDKSPVIDVKPYVAAFDSWPDSTAGWLERCAGRAHDMRADTRFAREGDACLPGAGGSSGGDSPTRCGGKKGGA